jgi:hypothetical protein
MGTNRKIFETQLYDIWKKKQYESDLKTLNGDDVDILDIGVQELDTGGPDFKNARIRIGNLTYVGDIEIDNDYRDWKTHGHNIDNKYNKVILHASLSNKFNQPYVYTKEGRKVPSICLDRFIDENLISKVEKKINVTVGESQLKCSTKIESVPNNIKEKLLTDLGIERFKKKCNKVHKRLKELIYINELKIKEPVFKYDLPPDFDEKPVDKTKFRDKEIWEQVFYEMLFEALGYSKNKMIMTNLARSVRMDFIKKFRNEKNYLELIETSLFGVGGLLPKENEIIPEKMSAYVSRLVRDWLVLKKIYDGRTYNEPDWHFFKLRPQNFPTIRLAAGARFLYQISEKNFVGVISKKLSEIRNLTVLINSLRSLFVMKAEGFWSQHFVFNKPGNTDIKYFVGAARADEIVVNVVLPLFAVYYEIFDDKKTAKKIYKLYTIYKQKSDNKIVRDVAKEIKMSEQVKRTVYSQGMIELFRNYCSKNKCVECLIGKQVFN